ncbi:dynein heavy chain, partial [Kipferlia bialata]
AFSLQTTLSDAVTVQGWKINGLPTDDFSVENAVIAFNSKRWPLMIDPQGQATAWIKTMEKENQLVTVKATDTDLIRSVQNAVRFGIPLLIEGLQEEVDPGLEALLLKQTYRSGSSVVIRIGDQNVEYSDSFRLYITTSMPNPDYPPEIATKVCVINFSITLAGLEDQMLIMTVGNERPELQEQKKAIIKQNSDNRRDLQEIEDTILKSLSESEGNLLDDVPLIDALSASKLKSAEIKEQLARAAETEELIDESRQMYRPVATRNLSQLNSTYQYSLSWFMSLFRRTLANADQPDKSLSEATRLERRLATLITDFTSLLYRMVCRSLFVQDTLLFSFHMACKIGVRAGDMDAATLRILLAGSGSIKDARYPNPDEKLFPAIRYPNPDEKLFPAIRWRELDAISEIDGFSGLCAHVMANLTQWKMWLTDINQPVPAPYDERLSAIGRLILIKHLLYVYVSLLPLYLCINTVMLSAIGRLILIKQMLPEKLIDNIRSFIATSLGDEYVSPPNFSLKDVYEDSTKSTPLVFILSAGADPVNSLLAFADQSSKHVDTVSLGRGQGPVAEKLIANARVSGRWVLLANLHLSASWAKNLELICEGFAADPRIHEDFRLWITSMPCKHFPVSVLQNSVKMTAQPPEGIKANVLRAYQAFPPGYVDNSVTGVNSDMYQRLLYSLCLFHAVCIERKRYGALGFNIPYGFTESDLQISQSQLKMFMEEFSDAGGVPYSALRFMTGEINIGGRVTDDLDRRLVMTTLNEFYTPKACIYMSSLSDPSYQYCASGAYKLPSLEEDSGKYLRYLDSGETETYTSVQALYLQRISELPSHDLPDVFGLNDNASIMLARSQSESLLFSALSMQPRTAASGSAAGSSEARIDALCDSILGMLPEAFDEAAVLRKYPPSAAYMECMCTVLYQDVVRFNILTSTLKVTLATLKKALKGLVVMDGDYEDMYRSMLDGLVPKMWSVSIV